MLLIEPRLRSGKLGAAHSKDNIVKRDRRLKVDADALMAKATERNILEVSRTLLAQYALRKKRRPTWRMCAAMFGLPTEL
jgi:hypothetical protein